MNQNEKKREHEKQEHFTIIVNARPKHLDEDRISYAEVVKLAFGDPAANTYYTITYSDGPKSNPQGTMSAGDTVEIKSGMKFYVTATTQS